MWFSPFHLPKLTLLYIDLIADWRSLFGFKNSQLSWWVKITTKMPQCIYFFCPFNSVWDAKSHQSDYLEDLMKEKALGISIEIEQCQPYNLSSSELD
jgi:hypothetical protein